MSRPTAGVQAWGAPYDESLLGATSVLWRYCGDRRLSLVLGRAVLLQVCHPTIGAGVEEHSEYREDPWSRLLKALFPIIDTVYAADGAEVGARIREAHRNIRGIDERGRRYHAWEPEAYWFVLASGLDCMIAMSELYFDEPIGDQDRERMLAEVREVGLRMGLRERDMAVGWAEFSEWYATTLVERLEDHPTARGVLETISRAPAPGWMPAKSLSGPVFSMCAGHVMMLVTVGSLPQSVRDLLGLGWSRRQDRELRALAWAVRWTFRWAPRPVRYVPAARRGFRRARSLA